MNNKISFFSIYYKEKAIFFFTYDKENTKNFTILDDNTEIKFILKAIESLIYNQQNIYISTAFSAKKIESYFADLIGIKVASGGIVQNKEKKFLAIYRKNLWDLPKGHNEPFETSKEAAKREISEECGLDEKDLIVNKKIQSTYYIIKRYNKLWLKKVDWYNVDYIGTKKPKPQIEEEIEKAIWITKEQLLEYYKNTLPTIKNVIFSYFNL